jgi:dethiobiotin synthetase
MKGLFVTGTDTEIGKTVVSGALVQALAAKGLRAAGMKPVASGGRETPAGLRNEDAEWLIRASNIEAQYAEVNPYCFVPPIAPHIAAREAGREIRFEPIMAAAEALAARADAIVIEGVGGWRVPLGPDGGVSELARRLALPVVLVVGMRLGCLNHAQLSAESIRGAGCPLAGWVANAVDTDMDRQDENFATLKQTLGAPCLGRIPRLSEPAPAAVASYLQLEGVLDEF